MFDWAQYFFDFVERNGVKMTGNSEETLQQFIDRSIKEQEASGWVFKPCAWYNKDGDQLEIYWSDEQDYSSELKGRKTGKDGIPYNVMGLKKSIDTDIPTGVTVYSLKHVLKEAGFELVPIKKEEK